MEGAAVALGVAAQELLDVLGILDDALLVAVVAVDEHDQMAGVERHLGAFVVAGGGAYATQGIAIDGEAVDVDLATSDAFVRFSLASDA